MIKLPNPSWMNPAHALIGQKENGAVEIVEYVAADDPRLATMEWISARPTDPGSALYLGPVLDKIRRPGGEITLTAADVNQLVDFAARHWTGCGNLHDFAGEPLSFPRTLEQRGEFLHWAQVSWLHVRICELAQRAMVAAMKRANREAADLGNSSTSSAGTTEAAGRATSAGATDTPTVQ